MPNQRFTSVAIRTCAVACALGLSFNSFVIASGAAKRETSGSFRTTSARFAPGQNPSPSPTPARTGASPAKDNMAQQSDQGRRYGQHGFVGEPISLNLVNADVRDILNYITEQYGINFVVDSSVSAVPVTVNMQEVPWNLALEMILRANKLGADVNGNILRIATTETLAKEAETQRIIKDSQLTNSPLVTEFIRLNYARASGTLATAAGSTGQFQGGTTGATVNGLGGDQSNFGAGGGGGMGGSGEQGVLPIVKRRLSRLGSVEFDGRSNTLIVTDVKENVEAIRQLVAILDQPEPQVEIETRIVIAQHNFSRDLGTQLSAGVLNSRGGLGSLSTLPSTSGTGGGGGGGNTSAVRTGPNPFGVFGGLDGTNQPINNLAAAAATTVIGLTTGLFGTAQITSLITAAERRGEVKTVATPRVTALNNRPAQIESGSQIPVQTLQTTTGTTAVTTTFVSVPLRLSITPQITDAGTVVLRVTIENNTVNTGIAVGGVPGIDTQRMQSEVLVPDGGTTVMGGVLADQESTLRQRTPGLASIPLVGNAFKRKTVSKDSTEILFFITPHIYRPDYYGRPTSTRPTDGPKMTSVPQPVPLGNPQTNTPTPTQLQQPQQDRPESTTPTVTPSGVSTPTGPARPNSQRPER